MKMLYLSHPLSGSTDEERQRNRENATRWAAFIAWRCQVAICADWIILSSIWSETQGRELGLKLDCEQVRRCDAVIVVGGRISSGMRIEIVAAKFSNKPICDLSKLGYEAPSFDGATTRAEQSRENEILWHIEEMLRAL